jgi:putative toxin-antitoxin system antitoxin component (TIGR02293 family)
MNIEQKLDKEITAVIRSSSNSDSLRSRKKVSYREFLSDKMLMISAIRDGIPYSLFALIKGVTPFTEDDWATLLNLSLKSLHRYKAGSKHFKPLQSEKIIEMAEVTKVGTEVFGDLEKFRLWLNTPSFALGKMKPIDLLQDSYGKELVIRELTHINYGIFA